MLKMSSLVVILSAVIALPSCSSLHSTRKDSTSQKEDLALIQAVESGNPSLVEAALRDGADVNAVDADGESALIVAIEGGHLSVVETLLKKGADVNAVDADGVSALNLAIKNGQTSIANALRTKVQPE